ncbi:MAG: GIY-YIG nuclease family protein [Thermodesulfobacteriota bacterium]
MKWFLYLLLCDQKTYYVGITRNLNKRLESHINKNSKFTKKFDDIKLIYFEEYKEENEAKKREKQLKGWSAAKKKALIDNNKNLLSI